MGHSAVDTLFTTGSYGETVYEIVASNLADDRTNRGGIGSQKASRRRALRKQPNHQWWRNPGWTREHIIGHSKCSLDGFIVVALKSVARYALGCLVQAVHPLTRLKERLATVGLATVSDRSEVRKPATLLLRSVLHSITTAAHAVLKHPVVSYALTAMPQ